MANHPHPKMENRVSIDSICGPIYGYYTRFPELKPITNDAFARTRADKLNIYVDLDDIFIRVDKQLSDNVVPDGSVEAIASCIINLCAHYRNFFINTYGVMTYFFLIGNSSNIYNEEKISAEYKHPKPINMYTALVKDSVMKILRSLVPYIPDISLLDTPNDFNTNALCIKEAIFIKDNNPPDMVISKDPCTFILGGYGFYILRPKKYKGADTSFIVLPEDAALLYFTSQSKALNPQISSFKYINALPLVAAMVGCASRKLKHINRASIIKIKQYVLDDKLILNTAHMRPEDIEFIIDSCGNANSNMIYTVLERVKVLDCYDLSQNMYLTGEFASRFISVNLYDPEKVKKLNETTFASYPLDLNAL